ncbi:MAG: hypothetical protein N2512_00995 [Armatimonadetes bacterium]|nr:hypothetical protein [Armatimonadota bacterium]
MRSNDGWPVNTLTQELVRDTAYGCLFLWGIWLIFAAIVAYCDTIWFKETMADDHMVIAHWLQWPTPSGLTVRQRFYQLFAYYWHKPKMINAKRFSQGALQSDALSIVPPSTSAINYDIYPAPVACLELRLWDVEADVDPDADRAEQIIFSVSYDPQTLLPIADPTYWGAVQYAYYIWPYRKIAPFPLLQKIDYQLNEHKARWLINFYHGGAPYDSVPVPPDPGDQLANYRKPRR